MSAIRKTQHGVSLVELMIAMLIGLFLVGATFSIYLENRQVSRSADILSRMQENARIAMELLSRDIKLAGYYGLTADAGWIQGTWGSSSPLATLAGDCINGWYIDLAVPVWAIDNANPYGGCIGASDYLAGTDILVARHASTQTVDVVNDTADLTGELLLRSSPSAGQLYTSPASPPGNFTGQVEDRTIHARAYYLRPFFQNNDNIPTLVVENLQDGGTSPTVQATALMPGVEQFQVQLGIDSDGDGSVDFYRDPETTAASAAIDPTSIVAVRLWLLMRSEQMENEINDLNTYTLGTLSYTPAAGVRNFRRVLFTTTVKTRNSF